jgi:hypothetical protein
MPTHTAQSALLLYNAAAARSAQMSAIPAQTLPNAQHSKVSGSKQHCKACQQFLALNRPTFQHPSKLVKGYRSIQLSTHTTLQTAEMMIPEPGGNRHHTSQSTSAIVGAMPSAICTYRTQHNAHHAAMLWLDWVS